MIFAAYTNTKTIQEGDYEIRRPTPRLEYYAPHKHITKDGFSDSIMHSLCAPQKYIESKFFYDARGSEIFESICNMPEYYLTRAETEILKRVSSDIASMFNARTRLVELGSGSSTKTKILLEAMNRAQGRVTYSPIDVSDILVSSSHKLLESYSWLDITGVNDTYENGLRLIHQNYDDPTLIMFLGSSLGNMDAMHAHKFLCSIRSSMHDNDIFLIGLDLDKDQSTLESAYDDAAGITAEFNYNLLNRINSELSANIEISKFEHCVQYNKTERRIETYLRSKEDQIVEICGKPVHFGRDELILTEYSHKYTPDDIHALIADARLRVNHIWYDSARRYALVACFCA